MSRDTTVAEMRVKVKTPRIETMRIEKLPVLQKNRSRTRGNVMIEDETKIMISKVKLINK